MARAAGEGEPFRPMRFEKTVLQIVPSLDAGGAERTTVEMARAIVAAGGRALVATSGGRLSAEIEKAGGELVLMPVDSKNPLVMYANAGKLARLIDAETVDLIHARSRAPAWSAFFAARRTRVPFVATHHGAYEAASPIKRLYNSAMARADLVIANSDFTAARIREDFAIAQTLAIIPRGADLEEFNPRLIARDRTEALRRRWRLVENPSFVTLLLPARVTAWKGHSVAIDALASLARTGAEPEFQLIFAGDKQGRGEYADTLQRRAVELGLQQMIRWVGHCDDMPGAYALADVVLSPSTRPEAFGRVAVEAGAMERVAIAADHGGARETIVDGVTGFLAMPGSAAALAAAIAKAVALGAGGRRAMGEAARARIAARYSTKAMCDATLAAYEALLSRMKGAPGRA